LRQTSSVVYIAYDDLTPPSGKALPGFDEFAAALDHAGVPTVWLSNRTRFQLDAPRKRLAHNHPFIAEGGCGAYLPEDYFHLRPESSAGSRGPGNTTVRLGRFTCLPVAEQQPAAAEALESLARESRAEIVRLSTLSPRELAQNSGLPPREAEQTRHRDFDELFFFAGTSPAEIARFQSSAGERKCQLRERGSLWSLAIGASVSRCVRELSKLYDRALHAHARTIAVSIEGPTAELAKACDRAILLVRQDTPKAEARGGSGGRVMEVPIHSPDPWEQTLRMILERS
jgi:predicted mannosyl-3-phosphoglycerate phosphatase (HAD superfamily)